jgi:dimethylargininase
MERTYGAQSMIEQLRRVLVKRPDQAFGTADPVRWHYRAQPDLQKAQSEHDQLAAILRDAGCEIIYHQENLTGLADAIYVHDPAMVTDQGAVILRMGKKLRRGEEAPMARQLKAVGIPILYTLHTGGRAEGGDLLWLDEDTLAVGLGPRTNIDGLRQLTETLSHGEISVVPVQLPAYRGPGSLIHLMSMISIVHHDLAVVYPPLLPEPFRRILEKRGFTLIPVPDGEFPTMGTNVLALAPGKCLMLEGNPVTRRRLEEAGCQVLTYRGEEISLKGRGGPTCLTRPILRNSEQPEELP